MTVLLPYSRWEDLYCYIKTQHLCPHVHPTFHILSKKIFTRMRLDRSDWAISACWHSAHGLSSQTVNRSVRSVGKRRRASSWANSRPSRVSEYTIRRGVLFSCDSWSTTMKCKSVNSRYGQCAELCACVGLRGGGSCYSQCGLCCLSSLSI